MNDTNMQQKQLYYCRYFCFNRRSLDALVCIFKRVAAEAFAFLLALNPGQIPSLVIVCRHTCLARSLSHFCSNLTMFHFQELPHRQSFRHVTAL